MDFPPPSPAADPLGMPAARADDRSPGGPYGGAGDSYANPTEKTVSYGGPSSETPSYGSELPSGPLTGGYGSGRDLSRTDSGIPGLGSTPAAPAASAGSTGSTGSTGSSGRSGDSDSHRLPTVDELLQRIQSDRARSAGTTGTGSKGYGESSSSGGSLTDPLNDPLSTTHDPSYGSGSPWSSGGSAPGQGHTDDLSGGQLSGSGLSGLSGLGGSGTGGYGSGGTGQGYSTDGYPSAPAYGEPPRYDDPLGGSSGRDSYGTFGGEHGGGTLSGSAGSSGAGGYDFGGGGGGGYGTPGDPNSTQAYGGYPPSSYGQPGDNRSDQNPYGQQDQAGDDWESHRDYRR